jgi:plastocyanin domain-containing protein
MNCSNSDQRNAPLNKPRLLLTILTISLALPTIVVSADKDAGAPAQNVREIQVTLRKYEFTPDLLHVKKGERVRLVIVAIDQAGRI